MKITVKNVTRRHGSLTITLEQDFLNGSTAHRAERILRKHMMRFQSGKGPMATFVAERDYNIDAISTVEGLQAAMDKWANVPVNLTFARRPTVNVFVENIPGHQEMRNATQLKAELAKGGRRVVVSHSVRLNNFPAIRRDTDQLEKVVRGGVYIDSGNWHVINMSGYLDIMDRRNDDPWDIAREWETAARKLVV